MVKSSQAFSLALLLVSASAVDAGEAKHLAFSVSATPGPGGGTYLVLSPGALVKDGIRVMSEPSGTPLAVIATAPFEETAEGRIWIREACAAAGPNCSFASVSRFDGIAKVQVFSKAHPVGDRTLAFYVKGFQIPASASPAGSEKEYVFRTPVGTLSPTTLSAFYAVEPGQARVEPLAYSQICCYAEGNPCRNCQNSKYGDVLACCLSAEGDQTCGGGNVGCNYSKATCGYCPICGP
jgi:hypothetical protein